MLASADSPDGPLEMQTVGEWDEDGIDVGVVENLFSTHTISSDWSVKISTEARVKPTLI